MSSPEKRKKKTVTEKPSSSPEKGKRKTVTEKPSTSPESTTNPSITASSSSSQKKKKTVTEKPTTPITISSLPDELMLSCIARLSKSHYPILSLVSKRFPNLLASSELYEARSLLNREETCLYVLLQTNQDLSTTRWFTLCHHHHRKPILVPIPTSQSPPSSSLYDSEIVASGCQIYIIGGITIDDNRPSSRVSIFDCRSHTFREAPNMRFERLIHSACVIDEKLYVVGNRGDEDHDCLKSIEVFDTKTRVWDLVPNPHWEINVDCYIFESAGFEGKLCLLNGCEKGFSYDLKKSKWDLVDGEMNRKLIWDQIYCVIENVLYCYDANQGKFLWYDSKLKTWEVLKGFVSLPMFRCYNVYPRPKLIDYGGRLAVLWEDESRFSDGKEILCAVIKVRRNGGEIWGEIESFNCLLNVPNSCHLVEAVSVTL